MLRGGCLFKSPSSSAAWHSMNGNGQRPEKAFRGLRSHSSLGNIDLAKKIVEKLWWVMGEGDGNSGDRAVIIESIGYGSSVHWAGIQGRIEAAYLELV